MSIYECGGRCGELKSEKEEKAFERHQDTNIPDTFDSLSVTNEPPACEQQERA